MQGVLFHEGSGEWLVHETDLSPVNAKVKNE
jgi:hypothetical protein